ncbi:MAG: heavy metal-binding domain-containing protein, partial [Pseudomonadota bacterium]
MKILLGLLAGVIMGVLAMVFVYGGLPGDTNTAEGSKQAASEPQPLYWVAPMDANYRRDKPGKSPMGMDLVPVYADDAGSGPDAGPGTISISPEVVNNLGVRTASAQPRRLQNRVRTVGYVQYDENRLTHIHPRVEGWVET